MANNIALAKTFVPILDEIYKLASLTSKLDGAAELVRPGANANELIVPMLSMQGLGDYSRNDGYVRGDVTMTNETVKCNYDRGRKFYVDALDEQETVQTAFSRLSGEFIRTKVVPELDAFRFASYAGKSGISKADAADLSDGAAVLAALRAAVTKMDEDEVPTENRHLFITPTLDGLIADMDTTKSKEILTRFATKTLVPQSRFYTAIDLKDGKSGGEEAGGYTKASGAKNINFMVIHPSALIQFQKHTVPKIEGPEDDLDGDRHMFGYRTVGIADVYASKLAGIYLHHAAEAGLGG